MVTVGVESDKAVFEVETRHKLWALKNRIEVPLAHIKQVNAIPDPPMGWFDGLNMMGTDLPHVFRAGTFWLHGSWAFFDVRHPEKAIEIELENEHYARLIVEVDDPEAVVRMLRDRLGQAHGTATSSS